MSHRVVEWHVNSHLVLECYVISHRVLELYVMSSRAQETRDYTGGTKRLMQYDVYIEFVAALM